VRAPFSFHSNADDLTSDLDGRTMGSGSSIHERRISMPAEPPEPKLGAADASVDAGLYSRLDGEIERLRSKLAALEAQRVALLESEQLRRAERAAARKPDIPGIPE
jgi:hypothetical protein